MTLCCNEGSCLRNLLIGCSSCLSGCKSFLRLHLVKDICHFVNDDIEKEAEEAPELTKGQLQGFSGWEGGLEKFLNGGSGHGGHGEHGGHGGHGEHGGHGGHGGHEAKSLFTEFW